MTRMWWRNQATKQWVCEDTKLIGTDERRATAVKQLKSFMTDVKSGVYMEIIYISTPWSDPYSFYILHTPTAFRKVEDFEVPAEIKLMKLLTENT